MAQAAESIFAPRDRARSCRSETPRQWWRNAVVYQVYVRSFADGNGDGAGDLAGVRARLPYLRDLGVDALWFNPWYPSPARRQRLRRRRLPRDRPGVRNARRRRGLDRGRARARHPHDRRRRPEPRLEPSIRGSARRSRPGPARRQRARFWFRPGRGADGGAPPNGWQLDLRRLGVDTSSHGRRVVPPPVRARAARPQLDAPRRLGASIEDVLRFWFDRGVAGVRIDSAALLIKDPELGEETPDARRASTRTWTATSSTTSTAAGARSPTATPSRACSSARSGSPTPSGSRATCGPDELHTAFNFDFLACPWDAEAPRVDRRRARSARAGRRAADVGALEPRRHPAGHAVRTRRHLVLVRGEAGRHPDRPRARHAPRPGRGAAHDGAAGLDVRLPGRGARPARGRGHPADRRQDPMCIRSGGVDPGRDGCRVPMPWCGDRPPFGFSPRGRRPPWLDQPDDWARLTVEAQDADPVVDAAPLPRRPAPPPRRPVGRRRRPALAARRPDDVLAFARGERFVCVVNFGADTGRRSRPAHDVLHRQRRARRRCCSRTTRRSGSARPTTGPDRLNGKEGR